MSATGTLDKGQSPDLKFPNRYLVCITVVANITCSGLTLAAASFPLSQGSKHSILSTSSENKSLLHGLQTDMFLVTGDSRRAKHECSDVLVACHRTKPPKDLHDKRY